MKKLFFSALLAVVFAGMAFSGCKDDDDSDAVGKVGLVFKAEFNGQPFVNSKRYDYLPGKQVFFDRFQFFVSEIELVRADGTAQKVSDIEYVSLTLNDETAAVAGKKIGYEVPAGEFTGVRFGIGVPASMNDKNPNQLPDTSPLTANSRGEFWVGWQSYIFMKIEGAFDADGDGALFENPMLYHCGSNAVYRKLTLLHDFHAEAGHEHEVELVFDIAKILRENGQPFDLVGSPATSDDPSDVVVATKLVDNLAAAVSIK